MGTIGRRANHEKGGITAAACVGNAAIGIGKLAMGILSSAVFT